MHPNILELLHFSADFIVRNQLPGGDIPWFKGGKTDPWDLTECAIALDICGRHEQARKAYLWLCEIQNPDGSWWYSYVNGEPHERAKDTNYSTYIVVGAWCHYLATADKAFLEQIWPSVEKALDFAVRLQQPEGHIHWGMDEFGNIWDEALIAGSSCVWPVRSVSPGPNGKRRAIGWLPLSGTAPSCSKVADSANVITRSAGSIRS